MNDNKFISQRNHTRIKFEPLTVGCELVCITPDTPATQTINTTVSPVEYEPNRQMSPTVILPDVRAIDRDKIFTNGSVNKYLSLDSLNWYVDDKPIATVWKLGTDYDIISDETDLRGALRIYKNFPASAKAVIHFKGVFNDWRTGQNYNVTSNYLALSCTAKGDDVIKCFADRSNIEYDPVQDTLLLFDYLVGLGEESSSNKSKYVGAKTYEQRVNLILTVGTKSYAKELPEGITMRLVRIGDTTALIPRGKSSMEIVNVSYPNIFFDMRMIDKEEYEVQFLRNNVIIARTAIGMHRKTTMPTDGKPLFGSDIPANAEVYQNELLLDIKNAELYYLIQWFTQAQYYDTVNKVWKYDDKKAWQLGKKMMVNIADLGIGVTKNDSYFDAFFEVEPHTPCSVLCDESGNYLSDENGNVLIG